MSVRLTEFSHGAGCGCKIAPDVLQTMLATQLSVPDDPNLLVGNHHNDDAAVYDLGDGTGLISTTDFFMPIADDPFQFGQIAAANALSDVYAMGGMPLMAIAILGWPIDKLSADIAGQVLDGGRAMCRDASIVLAGGHSIDCPEPIFGLAVSGRVALSQLKQNGGARSGDLLYLSKPLGVGVLTTAQKQKRLRDEHRHLAVNSMTRLNSIGADLSQSPAVNAMTDVTGFGLAGHLLEMCRASGLNAEVSLALLPVLPAVHDYLDLGCVPGGTERNYRSVADHLSLPKGRDYRLICDPQTSGGLLVAVDPAEQVRFETQFGAELTGPIGRFRSASGSPSVSVMD